MTVSPIPVLLGLLIGSFFLSTVHAHAYTDFPKQRSRDEFVHNCGTNPATSVGWFQGGDIEGKKCGPCGDDLRDPVPRANEHDGANGFWGPAAVYRQGPGKTFTSTVIIHDPHGGMGIRWRICEDAAQESSQDCFNAHILKVKSAVTLVPEFQKFITTDGTLVKISIGYRPGNNQEVGVVVTFDMPDIHCDRCVLQMTYLGGQDVIFRSCSDIQILPPPTPVEMLQSVGAGYTVGSPQCLSLTTPSGTTLELDECNGDELGQSIFPFQQWSAYETTPGSISFEATNKCLDVNGGSVKTGASIIQYPCTPHVNGDTREVDKFNQLWTIVRNRDNPDQFQLRSQAGNPKSPDPGNCLTASAKAVPKSSLPAWDILQTTCDPNNDFQLWRVRQ